METVVSDLSANVWKIVVAVGDRVIAGEPLMILESMKMEIPVVFDEDATVIAIHVQEGDSVASGAPLADLSTEDS